MSPVMASATASLPRALRPNHFPLLAGISPLCSLQTTQARCFFNLPLPDLSKFSTKEYTERRIMRYSQRQVYDVVANVDEYHRFLPYCTRSEVFTPVSAQQKSSGRPYTVKAELGVGFSGLKAERYVSEVTCEVPRQVKAESFNSSLFNHLSTTWRFTPYNPVGACAPEHYPVSILDFALSFEFASPLHAQAANLFFDQVSKSMIKAFEDRCRDVYGPPTET